MHVARGLSLEQTALRARELGWAEIEISGVPLFKRLRKAQRNGTTAPAQSLERTTDGLFPWRYDLREPERCGSGVLNHRYNCRGRPKSSKRFRLALMGGTPQSHPLTFVIISIK